ncbi:MAG: hypothetical protein KDN19_07380, partial [Verrucomicrobiae bacterium]|nr:hypothetical protein [Verrucomicrobiae bacterium]
GNDVPSNNSGTVSVEATTGSVALTGGESYAAYSQIGHGGLGGGSLINGTMSDNITVVAGGMVSLEGGGQSNAFALIGHGGVTVNGALSGDVSVTSGTGGVLVAGGNGAQSFAQIGSGGYNIDNDISGAVSVIGLGTADGDGVRVIGGEADYAVGQIGHGSNFGPGDLSGDVTVNVAAGGISLQASTEGYFSHAMIGHGGRDNEGDLSGVVTVNAASGDITLTGGAASAQYRRYTHAQIGHGGYRGTGQTGTYSDNVSVTAETGNVSLQGGDDYGTYTQIGHGGLALGVGRLGDISGDISVVAGGSTGITVTGGTDENSFALIGHGGHNSQGDMDGGVSVSATGDGGVSITGGSGLGTFAQIGNGGSLGTGSSVGATSVSTVSGDVVLQGGSNTDTAARIGAGGADTGGNKSGVVTVNSGGLLNLLGGLGDGAAAQVGHGGVRSIGFKSGDINVNADAITMTGGSTGAFTQIGHGGLGGRLGATGSVTVIVSDGDLTLDAGDADDSFALIGSGGSGIPTATFAGNVQALVQAGGVSLLGGGNGSFAQIGNGGFEINGSKTGSVLVSADQGIDLIAGDGAGSIAMIGMGGFNAPGNTLGGAGEIVQVLSGGDITLRASDIAEGVMAMIGNGGSNSDAVLAAADVIVSADGDINLNGGAANWAAAQIGNGGSATDGEKSGAILVSAGNDLNLIRGSGENAYAKIGHGDQQFTPMAGPAIPVGGAGYVGGDIQVTAGEDISLEGGMIGHLDPALANVGVGSGGDTFIAVSRNQPEFGGTGDLIGDADAVLSSDPSGELRLYLPGRANNLLAGSSLNGLSYPGANVDPLNQQIDELVIHQLDTNGAEVLTPSEHSNLDNWGVNLLTRTATADSANYSPVLGNYSLYYDTITVVEAGPPVVPTTPGGGTAGGSAGGAGDTGIGGETETPVDPVAPEPVPVYTVVGTDGRTIQVLGNPGEELGLFLRLPNGAVFYLVDRGSLNPLFFPVGDLIEDSLDDFLNDDNLTLFQENREPMDPWGDDGEPDFEFIYLADSRPGFSSFDFYGLDPSPFIDIVPVGIDDPLSEDRELREFIEKLEIEFEEIGISGLIDGGEPAVVELPMPAEAPVIPGTVAKTSGAAEFSPALIDFDEAEISDEFLETEETEIFDAE